MSREHPQRMENQMNQKTNRRRLVASAGALAAITAGGRLGTVLAQGGTSTPSPVASPVVATGTITGVVTDQETNEPLADVYVLVGWEDVQLAGITDAEGRYSVPNVPVGQTVDVLGYREGGYRYYNSLLDADTEFDLEAGQTVTHDFGLIPLNEPEGEPQLSDPVIDPERVMPGEEVTFEVTATNGKGGLSSLIFAANPEIGRVVLMESVGDDRFRTTVTFSSDTEPGEYPFAFFATSKECYVNSEFPVVTLHIGDTEGTPAAVLRPSRG